MEPHDFAAYHRDALERDEVRHNLILAILGRVADNRDIRCWTMGGPGECAVQVPKYAIVLGDVTAAQCRALAEETKGLDYPGVVGLDQTAQWFVDCALGVGVSFGQ